jgi:hypothetical protein
MTTFTPQPSPDWIALDQALPPVDKPVEFLKSTEKDKITGIVDFGYRLKDGTYRLRISHAEPFDFTHWKHSALAESFFEKKN